MSVLSISKKNFREEVLASPVPVLIDFWAPWCGPCRMFSPIIDDIAQAHAGDLKVVKINIDEEPELAQEYQVMSIPTLVLVKNGRPAATSVGLKSRQAVEALLG